MKPIPVIALALFAGLALPAAAADCGLMLRNQSLEVQGPGTFASRNGEFEFQLPFDRQIVEGGSFDNRCFYAINIDHPVEKGRSYSIEWVDTQSAMDDARHQAYWDGVLREYLARNFGNGGYRLVQSWSFQDAHGRKWIRFAGTGKHNGGKPGSIHGLSTHLGERMATVYLLTDTVITDEAGVLGSDAMREVQRFAETVECTSRKCGQ